jgi:serine/threonine-protein kinase
VTRPFLETDAADGAPQLSRDGRWLAYVSTESGQGRQVFVRTYPGPGGPWQVSTDGGNEPQWNPDGTELFYRNGRGMLAVAIDTRTGFTAGKPRLLFEGDFDRVHGSYARANYDVSADGKHFLMTPPATPNQAPPSEIVVVLHWADEVKRLAAARP